MNLELRPLLKDIKVVPKTCPKCHSVFVEDKKCESCGYDYSKKISLGPDDDRSFYNLMDDFFYEKKRFTILGLPLIPDRFFKPYKKLQRKIEFRLRDILTFLNNTLRVSKTEHFLLIREAQDIIQERSWDPKFRKGLEELKIKFASPRVNPIFNDLHLIPSSKSRSRILFVILLVLVSLYFFFQKYTAWPLVEHF